MSRRTWKKKLKQELSADVARIERELAASKEQMRFQERRIGTLEKRVDKLVTERRELQRALTRQAWDMSVLSKQVFQHSHHGVNHSQYGEVKVGWLKRQVQRFVNRGVTC